jgi:site-specific DNA-methyltransferase (adenine-specific)
VGINFFNIDCIEFMKQKPDKFYDLAIVDPPYGIGMGASLNVNSKTKFINKNWDKEIPTDEYFEQLLRVSKNQIVWGGNYFPYLWKNGCKGYICWNKLNHHDNRADVELAWTSFNKLAKYVEYMWDGNRYGTVGNIKGVGMPTIRIHPTEKPIYLYRWLLKNYAEKGNLILDTHGGSMSIAVACENEGFDIDICEIDKDYFNDAIKRFENVTAQTKLF